MERVEGGPAWSDPEPRSGDKEKTLHSVSSTSGVCECVSVRVRVCVCVCVCDRLLRIVHL